MPASREDFADALKTPTIALLGSSTRHWVLPLFAEHLEGNANGVSPEWFHERVEEAARAAVQAGDWGNDRRDPADRCREWKDNNWLDTTVDSEGRIRYALSEHALKAIEIIRGIAEGQSAVTASRLGSIAHAVHELAAKVNPDKQARIRLIEERIQELQRQKDDIATDRIRAATVDEMQQALDEVVSMTRSLPADFRRLHALVEQRHQAVARRALSDAPTKAEMVIDYLREHDLLEQTAQGRAYLGFTDMLASGQAQIIRSDMDEILTQDFARTHMTAAQRTQLDTLFSTLLAEDFKVRDSYLRWTATLRRLITRNVDGRNQRVLTLIDQALSAGTQWALADPGRRTLDEDILGIGQATVHDAGGLRPWRETSRQTVHITPETIDEPIPIADREALRLAAGTSRRAVARTVNRLIRKRRLVTGTDAFEATRPEFQRLGTLVSLLDLAIDYGQVQTELSEAVHLERPDERSLKVVLPHLIFDREIHLNDKGRP
ncbi:DUF3375 family protein [Gryllotalpicola koreensis]|uniref:DUF3375 domain-containing protein n=1 Tax=Gryllotalpicola koreensis TaxID=993086 RepID=A0ABP7ZQH7_9MICO